jgi:DNA-binding transcriptional MerR regulator
VGGCRRPDDRLVSRSDDAGPAAAGESTGQAARLRPDQAGSDPVGSENDPVGTQLRYTVAAVARRLGLAPATLRTWDRRYGLGPSLHTFGQHRRFTEADLARLQAMRRLTAQGVPPAEAARMVTDGAVPNDPGPVQPGPAGGGRVVALPGAGPDVRGLARAAMALDADTVTATIRRSLRDEGIATTWHGLVGPVLQAVGERWEATGEGVEVEHLLAESALTVLRSATPADPVDPARVLLAGAPDDYHSLPLHVLAAALAERGIATRNLGGAVPSEALADAVRRVGPSVLFLWSSLRRTGDPVQLTGLPATSPAASILVGGAGWWLEDLPARAVFSRDLPHAVGLIEQRLGR